MTKRYEAVIIGSGFGGAITGCRLSKKWPGKVAILERGKRFPLGSYPRAPHDMALNFWNRPEEAVSRPKKMRQKESHGMFDIRNFRHMDAVVAAGLGGGSLIYANVFLEPPKAVFDDERWPETCKQDQLRPYFDVAFEVMGARTIPEDPSDPRRQVMRTGVFQDFAKHAGKDSELLKLNVFFGPDMKRTIPIGEQARNRYGALQTSCTYCAECDVGCNIQAKNTLDLNYLYRAEHAYQADILTEHLAVKIVPVDAQGHDDVAQNGSHGYRVYGRDLSNGSSKDVSFLTQRVVVSAGTLGSNELLFRCRDVYASLPRISDKLGTQFSGNGDFLSFTLEGARPSNPNYGPVITQRTDFNLFKNYDPSKAFLLEDASYPSFLAWFIEGQKPGWMKLGPAWRAFKAFLSRWLKGQSTGSIGYLLEELLRGDVSYNTNVLLCMGLDRSDGTMSLDENGRIDVAWPYKNSESLYQAILEAGKAFKAYTGSKTFFPLPTWYKPLRKNVTVHALGGCVVGETAAQGVVSAQRANFGQVHNYQNLYCADGSILPTAVGANPTATISAMSEMVAHGITGLSPGTDL